MVIKAETVQPQYEPARPAFAYYGARVEVDGPVTLFDLRRILMKLEDLKVPDDATVQWGVPSVYVSWKR